MKKQSKIKWNYVPGILFLSAFFLFLFWLGTYTDLLRPELGISAAGGGFMISEAEIAKAAAAKTELLPDKRDYYDSLIVNEDYADKIVNAAAAISLSAEAEYFRDSVYYEGKETAIAVSEKSDLERAFYRYQQLKEEEPENYYNSDYTISMITMESGAPVVISSGSDFVKRLEETGFRGLCGWMQEAEKAFRRYKAEHSDSTLPHYTAVISGANFNYTENYFSVSFSWDSYYVRPELLNEIQEYTGDSYLLRKTAYSDGLFMLEYCTPSPNDDVISNSAAKRIRLYYRNGRMCRIAVIASGRQDKTLFSEQEEEMTLRFFAGLGMEEEEARNLFEILKDGSELKKSGRAGEFEWKSGRTNGMKEAVAYSIVIGETEY